MAEESVMDAVNAALEGKVQTAPEEPVTEEEVVAEGEQPEGEELPEGESTEEEVAEGEEAAEGEETATGEEAKPKTTEELAAEAAKLGIDVRDKGKFKSKEQLAAEIEAKKAEAPKLGADGKPVVEAKVKKALDPINDPIDKTLKVETQQRIRTLIDRTRDAEDRATSSQQNFDYLVNGVKATGATPEQYHDTLNWLACFNSQDPAKQAVALEQIEQLADRLSTMLGKERTVVDPLSAHPDLLAAVNAGQTSRKFATETARLRNGTTMRQEINTAATQQQEQAQAQAAEKEQARVDLNALEISLQASDKDYDRKKAIILPMLKVVFSRVRPAEWKGEFQRIYKEAKVQARVAPVRKGVPAQQSLRANKSGNGAGGGTAVKTEPKSPLDVINAALSSMPK